MDENRTTFPKKLVKKSLTYSFKKKKTKITDAALELSVKYLQLMTLEMLLRSIEEAQTSKEENADVHVDVIHLEASTRETLLDF